MSITRREGLIAGAAMVLAVPVARATPEAMAVVMREFTGAQPVRDGRVLLDLAPLIENGNAVPVSVTVQSPMTAADHVQSIAIFNERNPQPEVIVFHLGARAGRAVVSTRIRLATSQQVVALARMSDGSCWRHAVDVIVTLAACVEE